MNHREGQLIRAALKDLESAREEYAKHKELIDREHGFLASMRMEGHFRGIETRLQRVLDGELDGHGATRAQTETPE